MVIFNFCGQKIRFFESSQNSLAENSIFGHLRSLFSTYKFFAGRGGYFVIVHSTSSVSTKIELSGWSQKKVIQFCANLTDLAYFGYLGPLSKSIFSTYRQNFEKSWVSFRKEVVRNIVLTFELSISAGLWRGR